uniref:Uncharacterized protein n=1 Tax=viral metagenome TaxID=1070528 RepID=A0A6M3JPY5_9ZZZZ
MADEIKLEEPTKSYTVGSYLLYKLDRTVALIGVAVIAVFALVFLDASNSKAVAVAAIAAFGVYLGGRGGK